MSLEDKASKEWKAFKFVKPQKIQAIGFPDRKPRYFACAECEEVKVIQGYVARETSDLKDIQVIDKDTGRYLAYYCKKCFAQITQLNGTV